MTQKKWLIIGGIVVLGLFVMSVLMSVPNDKMQDNKFQAEMLKKPGVPAELKKPGSHSVVNVQRDALFGSIPLYFIPNKGQVDKSAAFYARTPHYTLWLTAGELVFDSPGSVTRDVSRLKFLGSNPQPGIIPQEMSEHRVNYCRGKDRSKWLTDIPTSKAVVYKNLFDRIDLKVYGQEKQVEYDWIVKPGADPKAIRFQYQGIAKTQVDGKGNLIVETKSGQLVHKKPVSYQVIEGEKIPVESSFAKAGENAYQFDVANYDHRYELVIDPVVTLAYSTYLNETEYCSDIAVDGNGCAYVTGLTKSSNFPTANAYDSSYNDNNDAFVTKFSSNGQSLVYSTYLGGSEREEGTGIAVDSNGCAYVTGYTLSEDFPTANSLDSTLNGDCDAFVTKFSSTGNSISYSTYLGGDDWEEGQDLAVDSSGCAYITGETFSDNFPLLDPIQETKGKDAIFSAFVTKISSSGTSMIYSTYLGGSGDAVGLGIAVDGNGNAYLTGWTWSPDFPLQNPFQSTGGIVFYAFVTKFSTSGTSLEYSTYLGGNDSFDTWGYDITVDSNGCAYVTGQTYSQSFPTQNAFQNTLKGDNDSFVTKFSAAGNTLVYSTYLGGYGEEAGNSIRVDNEGCAYVTGGTGSSDFPILNAYQSQNTGAFVTKFSAAGNSLVYSTYLGGSGSGIALNVDICGCGAYVTGSAFVSKLTYQE
jgi:hypothetical protein